MRIINIAILFVVFPVLLVYPQSNTEIKKLFNNAISDGGPSLSVLVTKEGKVKLNKSFGYANIEKDKKAGSQTNYYMANLTNQFTAMGILILSERNQLKLSDKVSAIITGFPGYGNKITVKHLLQQSSGLPYFKAQEFIDQNNEVTNNDVLEFLNKQDGLHFNPGKKVEINQVNYTILGIIIEEVSGDEYADFIDDEIFKPLHMKRPGVYDGKKYFWPWKKIKNKAVCYNPSDNGYNVNNTYEKIHYTGSTGVFVSPDDFAKWIDVWGTEKLLPYSTIEKAFKFSFMPGYIKFYGYGWQIGFNKGKRYAFQSTSHFGNTHISIYVPAEKISVSVFSNQGGLYGLRKKAFEILNQYSANEYVPE